jgi:hypothetical protein
MAKTSPKPEKPAESPKSPQGIKLGVEHHLAQLGINASITIPEPDLPCLSFKARVKENRSPSSGGNLLCY